MLDSLCSAGLLCPLIFAVGCANGLAEERGSAPQAGPTLVGSSAPAQGGLPSDTTWALGLAQGFNRLMLQATPMAEEKSPSDAVRHYAQLLKYEHRDALDRGNAVAKQQNIELGEVRPDIDARLEHQLRKIQDLEALRGDDFDRAFLAVMIQSHQEVISELNLLWEGVDNQAVLDLLDWVQPMLEDHMQRALALQQPQPPVVGNLHAPSP